MTVVGDLLDLIGRYGYLVIFLGVMAESAGVPLPGETPLAKENSSSTWEGVVRRDLSCEHMACSQLHRNIVR